MTSAGLLTKASMLGLYVYIHQHYRLVDLAWDSTYTWLAAALALDCGYYWFHRASHEVAEWRPRIGPDHPDTML